MHHPAAWLRLQLTPGLGRLGLICLIDHFESPLAALDALAAPRRWSGIPGLRADLAGAVPPADDPRLPPLLESLAARQAWLMTFWDEDYPPLLRSIADPPALLYGRGRRDIAAGLAIVGSRAPTLTGRLAAENFAREMAGQGLTIISGLARGIDAAAHHGALAAGGHTVAVLGCGIDRVYPPENASLYAQVAASGTLLSEYLPGSEPLAGHFPGRNRIISGLCRGTLVVEAAAGSGSLLTAEFALEQGREVFAVPGSIDRPTSAGVNRLIKEGAHPVTESSDLLAVLAPERLTRSGQPVPVQPPLLLAGRELAVWQALCATPRHSDELAGELGLTAGELSATLLHLELQGVVEQLPGARFVRSPQGSC